MNKKVVLDIWFIMLLISCNSKYPIDLGNGYKLDYDANSYSVILDSRGIGVISPSIVNYCFDSAYIIAEQKPIDSILKCIYNNPEYDLKKRNKLFEKSIFLQYWIINKKESGQYSLDTVSHLSHYSNVHGTYNREEYLQKRQELSVPRELKLKE